MDYRLGKNSKVTLEPYTASPEEILPNAASIAPGAVAYFGIDAIEADSTGRLYVSTSARAYQPEDFEGKAQAERMLRGFRFEEGIVLQGSPDMFYQGREWRHQNLVRPHDRLPRR